MTLKLESQSLTKLVITVDKMEEMCTALCTSYGIQEFTAVHISPSAYDKLRKEMDCSALYALPAIKSYQQLAIVVCQGYLSIRINRDISDNDFLLEDKQGVMYSYEHDFLNTLVERILLGGK